MQSLRPHAPTQGWPIKSCRIASSCISLLNKQVTSPSPNRVTQTSPCQSSTSDRDGNHRIERRICKRSIRKVIEQELMCIEINLENACTQGLARTAIRAATKGRDAKTVKNDPGCIYSRQCSITRMKNAKGRTQRITAIKTVTKYSAFMAKLRGVENRTSALASATRAKLAQRHATSRPTIIATVDPLAKTRTSNLPSNERKAVPLPRLGRFPTSSGAAGRSP